MGWFNHSHPPQWLANNFLFRYIFLFRKLFLTKRRSYYYGQEAEDVALRRIFPTKQNEGFFVDVGCFHPVKYNNTYHFYKRGWRGINIDIDPIKIQGFNWLRSGDTNIVKAVSDKEGTLRYWTNGFYSLVNTLDEEVAKSRGNSELRTVATDTLVNIIDGTKYKDQQIDILSIDAEGHDFVVLQSLDFSRYQPKVIVIETYAKRLAVVVELDIYKFLQQYNYDLVNWTGLSLIFQRNDVVLK
ncbi:MAG: FkbM family methyltransferase [Saprospiraceae bacterium]